jgi:hypothetical protein
MAVCNQIFLLAARGGRVALFEQWLPALQGEHFKVKLTHPLWSLVAWIAGEKTPV